ncbi:MAG: EVE domain-containing protein [Gemmatimonadetes bacterium]|nr:EVE domain-containing protein [Gemmatimonadota bacterium]
MHYWILKTEPSSYSFDQMVQDGTAVWDGVKNPLALKYLRDMEPGDKVLIYHTGEERSVVGHAEVTSAAYPDPKAGDPKLVVVNLRAGRPLPKPVTLAQIKTDHLFMDLGLVRQARLSVIPATEDQWKRLVEMSER